MSKTLIYKTLWRLLPILNYLFCIIIDWIESLFVGLFFVQIGSILNHQSFIAVCLKKKSFVFVRY
ncbi:hypothetical protein SAMN05192582_11424 [Bacteroides ovatus]|uniref:Uncharacterized protein n=1 Tax=Bacteroides ovatus TaxID=28116 RepID=A0A1G8RK61_BACOV|nr:hypothetical protein SAMN05192582_11424 [Bacteroides ovatus]